MTKGIQLEIKYSIITFIGVIAVYTFLHFFPFEEFGGLVNSSWGFLPLLIPCFTIALGIRERKNKLLDGEIDFGRAFATGLIISIFYATLVTIALAVAWPWLELAATEQMIESERARLAEGGHPPEEVDELIRQIKGVTSLPMQMMQTFMSNLIAGMLISLVVAFGFKRPEYPE